MEASRERHAPKILYFSLAMFGRRKGKGKKPRREPFKNLAVVKFTDMPKCRGKLPLFLSLLIDPGLESF